jgi:hypothetical protein
MPPTVREMSVSVGPPGTKQGTGEPLVRNVPGPVPFTINTTWFALEGGTWRLTLAVKDDRGEPVEVVSGFRWAKQHTESHDFGPPRSTFREQQTLLLLIERGGVLTFERQISGTTVGQAELEIEVEFAKHLDQETQETPPHP